MWTLHVSRIGEMIDAHKNGLWNEAICDIWVWGGAAAINMHH
jgi:hypothetical protein